MSWATCCSLANRVNPDFVDDIEQHQAELEGDAIEAAIKASTLEVTEKLQLTKARIGQGDFRKNWKLLSLFAGSPASPTRPCSLPATSSPGLSAITTPSAWMETMACCSPSHRQAVRPGLITFTDAGDLLLL